MKPGDTFQQDGKPYVFRLDKPYSDGCQKCVFKDDREACHQAPDCFDSDFPNEGYFEELNHRTPPKAP